jgi:two-component system sensor histidine kinase YesM
MAFTFLRLSALTLRTKLVLSSVVCILFPIGCTVAISNYLTQDIIHEQAVSNSVESLEVAEFYITSLMSDVINISSYIQFDREISGVIGEEWNMKGINVNNPEENKKLLDMAKISEKLQAYTQTGTNVYVTVLSKGGNAYTNYSYYENDPMRFFQQPWFMALNQLSAFDIHWLGAHPTYIRSERERNPFVITFTRTFRSYASEPYGYMIVSINESQIHEIFKKFHGSQQMMLVDGSGKIISDRNSSLIGKTFAYFDELPADNGKAALTSIGGVSYLLTGRTLPYADWVLVSLVPYQEAVGKINVLNRTIFVVLPIVFIVFLAILVVLMRQFTKPVVLLGRFVSRVGDGNLDIRHPAAESDEIGKLGQTLNDMLDRIQMMIRQMTLEQALKHKAQLDMLQAQINPHFLFNVLNSIRMKIMMGGDSQSAELVGSLSSLLRMTINRNNEFVTLQEEANTVVHYVRLLNFRHHQIIELEQRLASDCLLEEIPRFTIQPLIENAFLHGLQQKQGVIRIAAWKERGGLTICISDNGVGIDPEQLETVRETVRSDWGEMPSAEGKSLPGIGLRNVYTRLRLIYGEAVKLEFDSRLGEGTEISLWIPAIQRGGKSDVYRDAGG